MQNHGSHQRPLNINIVAQNPIVGFDPSPFACSNSPVVVMCSATENPPGAKITSPVGSLGVFFGLVSALFPLIWFSKMVRAAHECVLHMTVHCKRHKEQSLKIVEVVKSMAFLIPAVGHGLFHRSLCGEQHRRLQRLQGKPGTVACQVFFGLFSVAATYWILEYS